MKKSLVEIDVIPHDQQSYNTLGDYAYGPEHEMSVVVSDLGDWRYEMLVGIHEVIEFALLRNRGESDPGKLSTDFDLAWEKQHATLTLEPGDDPASPYQQEHNFATAVERMLCAALGVKWYDYEAACEKASEAWPQTENTAPAAQGDHAGDEHPR